MPGVFRILEKIKPVYDWAYKIMLFICKLLLIADIVITSITVAGRYFPFFTAPHWGEEIVLTLMVYMAVLSATLAIRKRSHIRMTAFDKYLPRKALMTLDLVADIAVLALGVVLLVEGGESRQPHRQHCQVRQVFLSAQPEPNLDVHACARGGCRHDHLRAGAGVPAH